MTSPPIATVRTFTVTDAQVPIPDPERELYREFGGCSSAWALLDADDQWSVDEPLAHAGRGGQR